MIRIFDITYKDLIQLLRERQTFLFLLIMPIAFTLLFGYTSGGYSKGLSDTRLPVGLLDEDRSWLSESLQNLLNDSSIIRLDMSLPGSRDKLETLVSEEKLAAAIIIPEEYGHKMLEGKPAKLTLIADTTSTTGKTIESEALTATIHLDSAVRTAIILDRVAGNQLPFDYTYEKAINAWKDPPIQVKVNTSAVLEKMSKVNQALAHTSPGMMLQFSIAGLLTTAQIIVSERKNRSLQRLLTTATSRGQILFGHYFALFVLTLCQFLILISFGQIALGVPYFNQPLATLLVAGCAALCISALGLLIGITAKNDEQAIIFALVLMFTLSGLGGAMAPLEVASPAFQAVGHLSPIAWAMDGFKNIILRGQGLSSVLLPCAALCGYAILFFFLANSRFAGVEEK